MYSFILLHSGSRRCN